MWDEEHNHHLFTATALAESAKLLEMVARHDMQMVLPKDIPTLEALATKNWTHPDNIFCSANMVDKIVYCTTDPRLRGPGMDHVPILMVLEFPVHQPLVTPSLNFWEVEWDEFKVELEERIADIHSPEPIRMVEEFATAVTELTRAIQGTIHAKVPQSWPSPHLKRWWSKELSALKKLKNNLSSTSYKYRALMSHPSHEEHRRI